MNLIQKTRKLNRILQNAGNVQLSFKDLCASMMGILESNVYVVNGRGKVLGMSLKDVEDAIISENQGDEVLPADIAENLLIITESKFNLTQDDLIEIFKGDVQSYTKFATVVPVIGNGQRLGTFIIARREEAYEEVDLILAEYAATIIGLEIIKAKREESEEEARRKSVVQMAIGTLSYSEIEAIEHIFDELDGEEGLLIASKIADRAGITRSVIVNALRKFESAGVIESRSLGMKGTYIKVLNDKLLPELALLKK